MQKIIWVNKFSAPEPPCRKWVSDTVPAPVPVSNITNMGLSISTLCCLHDLCISPVLNVTELPLLYKTLDIQHLVCTTYHLYNTSFVQNLYIQQLICTTLTFTTSHLYNTLDTQHLDIQHFKFNVQPLIWELLYHTFPFKHFYLKIGSNQKVRAG